MQRDWTQAQARSNGWGEPTVRDETTFAQGKGSEHAGGSWKVEWSPGGHGRECMPTLQVISIFTRRNSEEWKALGRASRSSALTTPLPPLCQDDGKIISGLHVLPLPVRVALPFLCLLCLQFLHFSINRE